VRTKIRQKPESDTLWRVLKPKHRDLSTLNFIKFHKNHSKSFTKKERFVNGNLQFFI
jgi:hypothetical protein